MGIELGHGIGLMAGNLSLGKRVDTGSRVVTTTGHKQALRHLTCVPKSCQSARGLSFSWVGAKRGKQRLPSSQQLLISMLLAALLPTNSHDDHRFGMPKADGPYSLADDLR
jgi:hypothetical protein